ncbi:hypothetical protein I4U23_002306 [Adineta vaga]|nr:hypothetical protein I4U23_002306 [Adineta vaga]
MAYKCQIVPELAAAVHGVTEEIPVIPESPSPKAARSRLASSIRQQVLQITSIYVYHRNRDGKLTIKEFQSVMHDLGYKTVDKRFIRQMFAEANQNGHSHVLSYNDFVQFLESKLSLTTQNHLALNEDLNLLSEPKMEFDIETLFNCYDLDKNGYIEPKELRKVMKRLTGEKLSKRDIEEMISVADRNGDGLLDKSEFALLCGAF